jgi:hypothetical protein
MIRGTGPTAAACLAEYCPRCGRGPGDNCQSPKGYSLGGVIHTARKQAAANNSQITMITGGNQK